MENKAFAIIMFSEEIFTNNKELKKKLFTIMEKQKKFLCSVIIESQDKNEVRSDIPGEHIFVTIIGSLRFLVTQWKMRNFDNYLVEKGNELWQSLRKIIEQ